MVSKRELLDRHERRFSAGTVIYREGSIGEEMYVVRSGRVELTKKSPRGSTRLAVLGPGEFFGETEGLGRGTHSATARVLEDAALLAISAETLRDLVSGSAEIATRIITQLAERTIDVHRRVGAMAERDLHGRILCALAALADASDPNDANGQEVVLSNGRLARAACVDESTLLNAIDRLSSEGLVRRIDTERIWIAPRARLDAYLNAQAISGKTRVLIVDDSPLFRAAIGQALSDDPHLEVVGVAENGREAVELVEKLQPDVITMDVQMPDMSGLEAIPRIMASFPTPILVLTSLADIDDGSIACEALRSGALDLWPKPTHLPPWPEESHALAAQLHRLARIELRQRPKKEEHDDAAERRTTADLFPILPPAGAAARRIAIVADTGGPAAVASLLQKLPRPFPAQILLAQKLDGMRPEQLAAWLAKRCEMEVRVARDGDPYEAGVALLSPAGSTITLSERGTIALVDAREDRADLLLASLAERDGIDSVGVVLSGAGRDGVEGLARLVEAGGIALVLHPGDAVVDELPRAALEEAPSCRVVSGAELPGLLARIVGAPGSGH